MGTRHAALLAGAIPVSAGDEDAARTVSPELRETARRRGLVAAAGHRADEASIRAHLADPSAQVRATALAALVRAGVATAADGASAQVDPDAEVRRVACELAPALPGADYLVLLGDPAPSVVEAAAFALGEVVSLDAVPQLSDVARHHRDPLCRESAVAALGAIGDEAGLPAILGALDDRPAIRRRATLALAPFGGPEVDAALQRSLVDKDWQVRQAAEDLLGPGASRPG
jgi:HEAT repeat protein